jgi:hypothetical protein
MRSLSRLGSSLSIYGVGKIGSQLSVLDYIFGGSAISMRSFGRLGSAVSLYGCSGLGRFASIMDYSCIASALSVRTYARLGSSVSVYGIVQLGSPIDSTFFAHSVLDAINLGSSLSIRSYSRLGVVSHFTGLAVWHHPCPFSIFSTWEVAFHYVAMPVSDLLLASMELEVVGPHCPFLI